MKPRMQYSGSGMFQRDRGPQFIRRGSLTIWSRILLIIFFAGCADLKPELPAPVGPGVRVHGAGWADTASTGFHGTVLSSSGGNVQSCLTCHGWDFNGGTSNVSCVECHQSSNASIHGRGWTNPGSSNFHGNAIRAAGWDMSGCQSCHGPTYAGGRVNSSCLDCHTGDTGPENCVTCHGSTNPAPPRDLSGNTARSARGVGAHQLHLLGTSRASGMPCSECHVVPPALYHPGHVDSNSPAELVFNAALAHTVTNESTTVDWDASLPVFRPVPAYNAADGSCGNTYCHGHFKNGNTEFRPVWNDVSGQAAACGTCHGDVTRPTLAERALPKTSALGGTHPNSTACASCHSQVVQGTGNDIRIISAAAHMNGKLNVFGTERDY